MNFSSRENRERIVVNGPYFLNSDDLHMQYDIGPGVLILPIGIFSKFLYESDC